MSDPYYDSFVKQVHDEATKSHDKATTFWAVVDGIAGVIDPLADTSFGTASTGLQTVIKKLKGKKDTPVPNPWFVFNGHEDRDTSYVKKYMKHRGYLSKGSSALGFASSAASQVTQVDVGGILRHGNALASTSAHIYQLRAIASNYKQSRTLVGWFDLIIKMKMIKAGSRGASLAGAAIPIGAVGVATDITNAAITMGVKLTMTKVCLATSADIHWRAFQEQAISGGLFGAKGKVGPASRIMYEIFARRGATRLLGKHDVDKIIMDPTGWLALNDKLMLL